MKQVLMKSQEKEVLRYEMTGRALVNKKNLSFIDENSHYGNLEKAKPWNVLLLTFSRHKTISA